MANRFWVPTGSGTWSNSDTTNWSTSTGGTSGASVPITSDTAIFDNNSGTAIIPTNYNVNVLALQLTSGPFTGTLQLGGNLSLANNSSGVLTLQGGSLNGNNFNISCWSVIGTGTATRAVQMGNGNWTLTGNNTTIWNISNTGMTLTPGNSTIIVTDLGTNSKTLQLGGVAINNITIPAGGSGVIAFNTSTTSVAINGLLTVTGPKTIIFQNNRIFTLAMAPIISGTSGNLVMLSSNLAGTQTTLSYSGTGNVILDYLSLQDSKVLPTVIWYAGANSTNVSNNTNWIFTTGPVIGTGQGILSIL